LSNIQTILIVFQEGPPWGGKNLPVCWPVSRSASPLIFIDIDGSDLETA
jgi:hypothetical protein